MTRDTAAYWERKDRELAADVAAEAAQARTLQGRLDAAERRLSALQADGGAWSVAAEVAAAQALVNELTAELAAAEQARFSAEWTRETTVARRAAWNARIKSGEFTGRNGKADLVKVNAAEKAQGWTMNSLKRAVAQHGL